MDTTEKSPETASSTSSHPPLSIPYPQLLESPIKRSAYSDRTAWIMALMSKLAYVRFEDSTPATEALSDVLKLITGKHDPAEQEDANRIDTAFSKTKLLAILENVAGESDRGANLKYLIDSLDKLNFTRVCEFSVNIPLIADTQAFLARLDSPDREPFLVLAFRGTETKKPTDIKSDLQAEPLSLGALGGPGGSLFIPEGDDLTTAQALWPKVKVHPGFWAAFGAVKKQIVDKLDESGLEGLPLYITGHSLGGALAVVAAYALESDRIAAAYTFGGPRVGNLQFGQRIKPPVYRVIHASDIVPRLPPGILVDAFTLFFKWMVFVPYNEQIAGFLERFRGYRHYGDLRYLTASVESRGADTGLSAYPTLIVRANPPQFMRWFWLWRRWVATFGKAAVQDHSIDEYVKRLHYWAHVRSNT